MYSNLGTAQYAAHHPPFVLFKSTIHNHQSSIINWNAPEVPLDDGRILVLEYT
jgi:hypothetical protein